jgi:hypothetical protein
MPPFHLWTNRTYGATHRFWTNSLLPGVDSVFDIEQIAQGFVKMNSGRWWSEE